MIELGVCRAATAGGQLDAVNAETVHGMTMWPDLKDDPWRRSDFRTR